MYIELFLLDNALMNLLICRLAAALCGRRMAWGRAAAASCLGAVYAAAAFVYPALMALPCKLALCLAMGLALPFKGRRGYAAGAVAMFAASCIVGGMAFFLAYAAGGGSAGGAAMGGVTLRLILVTALCAAAAPSIARRLRSRAGAERMMGRLSLSIEGGEYTMEALVDSGNTLMEPFSGMPVAVAYLPWARELARIPIPADTVGGGAVLYALRPERAEFMGQELDMLIALADRPVQPGALIPPAALPGCFGIDVSDKRGGMDIA